MAIKSKTIYVCSQCGGETSKWFGRCPECGEWNTLEEQVKNVVTGPKKSGMSTGASSGAKAVEPQNIHNITFGDEDRYSTGLGELDRVLGGGIVKGSLVLLSGEPGIGKSTLLLQICEYLGREQKVLYITGEESEKQIKVRALRLQVESQNLYVATITDAQTIVDTILRQCPDIVIVDSIQTMHVDSIPSSSGSVSQVRESTQLLMRVAKEQGISIFIVGHVNKDGAIAGPKVLEHMVDAVLYFEGERNLSYRILRAVKNRYGSTNEIGVFEMHDTGLIEVENPSQMLLSDRPQNVSGTCVACVMEGSRPILAEIQALVSKSGFAAPRRTATGFDYNRTSLLIAVLEKRAGFFFGTLDVYLNVVGGLRLDEPAADLAVALALMSSVTDKVIDQSVAAFGEVGLAGEIRAVTSIEQRLTEASRLGLTKCIIPKRSLRSIKNPEKYPMDIIGVSYIGEAFKALSR
ncbi:DNA repair protein RadA [Zongyangia hominis]|uniref:DNA repair protein RadA n=1 Tax=Zongyangia hominis TaxID=2763677 RepID=UPI0021CCF70C|nr:DNA repair protein RadA [Zongyangia hominis]